MMRKSLPALVLICFGSILWLTLPGAALAQNETAYDLINTVNALRAAHGLAAYQVDPWLMSFAQEHSDYQAAIQTGTHQHRDGTIPWDIGLQENVASGDAGIMTVAIVVYQIWVDWGHLHPMIGYLTGEIGAGIALGADGQVYYTIDIRPGQAVPGDTPEPGATASFVPLLTSTPDESGAIFHVVGTGQTLWSIALSYGLTANDIRQLNGMAPDNTFIYVGQRLLIRPGGSVTPSPSALRSPTSTPLPSATLIPIEDNPVGQLTSQEIGTLLLVVGGLGILLVLIFGFLRPVKKPPENGTKS
jgi:LysM repeat protein